MKRLFLASLLFGLVVFLLACAIFSAWIFIRTSTVTKDYEPIDTTMYFDLVFEGDTVIHK